MTDAERITQLEAENKRLREAILIYLNGRPLDEQGRFLHPRLNALYNALEID
jgi:hypothetical protein